MPSVPFSDLPDDARLWVFAAEHPVRAGAADQLLAAVDAFLAQWRAHGDPLTCARDWRDDRFLAVGVDQSDAHASGCSIDGLFRALSALEPAIGTSLLGGGQIYFRDAAGEVRCVDRERFGDLAGAGAVTGETPVFDTTVGTAGDWRRAFELPAARSWHGQLLPHAVR